MIGEVRTLAEGRNADIVRASLRPGSYMLNVPLILPKRKRNDFSLFYFMRRMLHVHCIAHACYIALHMLYGIWL